MKIFDLLRTSRPVTPDLTPIGTVLDVASGKLERAWVLLHSLKSSSGIVVRVVGRGAVFDHAFDLAPIKIRYAGDVRRVRVSVGDVDRAEAAMNAWPTEWREAYQIGQESLVAARRLKAQGAQTVEVERM